MANKRVLDIEETCAKAARPAAPSEQATPRTEAELKGWFAHTHFGCMKSPLVAHFEPAVDCEHRCVYCYVNGYFCKNRKPSAAMADERTDAQIVAATRVKADKMCAKALKLSKGEWNDGMRPEMHFSISTDSLQPVAEVQRRVLLVMKTWLEKDLLISVVSKGVPLPEYRAAFLELWAAHRDRVSFQGTCASVDAKKQALVEPGAPAPEERMRFLSDVINVAGVKRASLRMNPLIPGVNDSPNQLRATVDRAGQIPGLVHIAVSYMYSSETIFRIIERRAPLRIRSSFSATKVGLEGGNGKLHVSIEARRAAHELVADRAFNKYGMIVHSCGCDNADLYPDQKCGISWRSGGLEIRPYMIPKNM